MSTIKDPNSQIDHLRFKHYEGVSATFNNSADATVLISSIDSNLANAKMIFAYRSGNFFQCTTNGAKTHVSLHIPVAATITYNDIQLLAIF